MSRIKEITSFYKILSELEDRLGGKRCLATCHGKMDWPKLGVYYFFESREVRTSSQGLRVVRVGTHAVTRNSKSTLWNRLRTHRGALKGKWADGGNHRGSIFRHHIGSAILMKEGLESQHPDWEGKASTTNRVRVREYPIERKVSQHIREMPFLWLKVEDPPGPQSQRAYIEKNSIILLSNYGKINTNEAIDPPSLDWLGSYCKNDKVSHSGLWNDIHVTERQRDTKFLNDLNRLVECI